MPLLADVSRRAVLRRGRSSTSGGSPTGWSSSTGRAATTWAYSNSYVTDPTWQRMLTATQPTAGRPVPTGGPTSAAAQRRSRYALAPTAPSSTEVTLTCDWSAVPPFVREYITFPPFPVGHLTNSLSHLAGLAPAVAAGTRGWRCRRRRTCVGCTTGRSAGV